MQFHPHKYQQFCIDFLKNHTVAALFLDMGLGKTVITLTAICDLQKAGQIKKPLVIAPLRVARDSWPMELQKWKHLQNLTVSVMVGTKAQRIKALNQQSDLYVINRESVKWLVQHYRNSGMVWDFDCVVIDELSSFKNGQSKRFQWLNKVRRYTNRWIGLTGTPTSKGLTDLWGEISILDGGRRLGRSNTAFLNRYFKPDYVDFFTNVVYSYSPKPNAAQQIYDKISDMVISMKAIDHLHLPECVSVNHVVTMDSKERKMYDKLKAELVVSVSEGELIDAKNAASLTGKLLQMCNGAVYDDGNSVHVIHDKKLEMLLDLIESANGQPVLVAFWFKHDKQRIVDYLRDKGYEPTELKESSDFQNWNEGNIPVALINPASAGHGVNLQHGGHILIWYSMVWSLELYQQTNGRLWRQGQTKTVSIHHIVCKDTVDMDVQKALESKDLTQEKLIQAVKASIL